MDDIERNLMVAKDIEAMRETIQKLVEALRMVRHRDARWIDDKLVTEAIELAKPWLAPSVEINFQATELDPKVKFTRKTPEPLKDGEGKYLIYPNIDGE